MSLAEQSKAPDTELATFLAPSTIDVGDSAPDTTYVQRAEFLRDRAWADVDGFCWNGRPLYAYSLGRHTLIHALHRADAPSEDLIDLAGVFERIDKYRVAAQAEVTQQLTDEDWDVAKFVDVTSYLPMAVKILWFCSHEPKDWRALRVGTMATWLEAIDEWAEKNVPANRQTFLVTLAYRLRTDYLRMLTIAPPTSGNGRDSGNALGL